jgi:hypothetical protein
LVAIVITAWSRLQNSGGVVEGLYGLAVWVEWLLTGAIVGAFGWIVSRPRARFTRGVLVAVAFNWMAWAAFLILTPPVEHAKFQKIADQRAARDAGALSLMTDQPTIMASRWFGGFRPLPPTERLLFLMAGMPVLAASQAVVPARYLGDLPTRGESWIIALLGFSVSTAFWACVGATTEWLRKGRVAVQANRPSSADDSA